MVPQKQGLIVNISSVGGLRHVLNAAYGIGKEACDRMTADCGFELQKHNVAFVSLWPSTVCTEHVLKLFEESATTGKLNEMGGQPAKTETPEFAGQCVVALAADPDLMKMSGKILLTYDLGMRYGLRDADGHGPTDLCSVKLALMHTGHTWLGRIVPEFVRFPKWLMALGGYKFY